MAGYYVLNGLTNSMIRQMNSILTEPGTTHAGGLNTVLQHPAGGAIPGGGAYLGWTNQSRTILQNCFDNNPPVADRSQLPPHYYYEISAANRNINRLINVMNLNLVRTNNFHLRNLSIAAQNEWLAGRFENSLIEQVHAGAVSLEVYYIGGVEVG